MPHIIETLSEFQQRHGDSVLSNGRRIFESGAISSPDLSARNEPPPDKTERLKVQRAFWEARERKAAAAFHDYQTGVAEQSRLYNRYNASGHGSIMAPPSDALEVASELRDAVLLIREQLEDIDQQIEQERPPEDPKQLALEQRIRELAQERELSVAKARALSLEL